MKGNGDLADAKAKQSCTILYSKRYFAQIEHKCNNVPKQVCIGSMKKCTILFKSENVKEYKNSSAVLSTHRRRRC